MIDIKNTMSEEIAKKIFGNKENAEKFLIELNQKRNLNLKQRRIKKGKNKGKIILDYSTKELWKKIVREWNYEEALPIIRKIFTETAKYQRGKEAEKALQLLKEQWEQLKLGPIAWPFSQGAFDDFVQRINSENIDGLIKDEKVKIAAVKYRRIKEINTLRNDFIETLIFEKNENILPTLNHRRGVDFFINGIAFDQKVAKSPTKEFQRKFKENWKQKAIENPSLVAEYLYKYQDEGRFGANPRLLIVYLDEDITAEMIKQQIDKSDLTNPLEITFTYKHKNFGERTYKVKCFVILLYKIES